VIRAIAAATTAGSPGTDKTAYSEGHLAKVIEKYFG
jgi:hypothetical protein